MSDQPEEPFETGRATLMTAGLAIANDRVVEALVSLLEAKGIVTAGELAARLEEPDFQAETGARSAAFYQAIKKK